MSLTLVTPPVGEVLSLREVKEHLRIDHAHDDVYLLGLIRAATAHVEGPNGWLGRALLTQTWDEFFHCFPYGGSYDGLSLALSPIQSVTSIAYIDSNGTPQTWLSTEYAPDLKSEPAWIYPAPGFSFPSTRRVPNAVTVRYVAGWLTRAVVPQSIRQGLTFLVAHWYEHREPVVVGGGVASSVTLPMHVDALLAPYRVWSVAA